MPFHYLEGNCNWLTNAALDRIARAPEYKVCACRVEKIPEREAYTADGTYISQKLVAQLKEAELKLKTKQSDLKKTEHLLANAVVKSPVDGRITTLGEDSNDGQPKAYITIQQTADC